MIPLWSAILGALGLSALLEEAAAGYAAEAVESERNDEDPAALRQARRARQARLLGRLLVGFSFAAATVAAMRSGAPGPISAALVAGPVWVVVAAGLLGLRRESPWSAAGRWIFEPLRWAGDLLRGLLLAAGRLSGLGTPLPSVDRVLELEEEIRWLQGAPPGDEAETMVAALQQFGEARVEDVMVQRESVVGVPAEATVPELLAVVRTEGYSRYPVYSGTLDTVSGVLHVLDLLGADPERTAQDLARAPLLTPATKPVGALLRELQTTYNQMAVVVDEYGGTAGLVTVEDLIEELVGEIEDELDIESPRIRKLGTDTFWVDAALPVAEVNEALDLELEEGEFDTVAGLVLERLERIPRVGEVIREDGVRIEVVAAESHRIQALKLIVVAGESKPREEPR